MLDTKANKYIGGIIMAYHSRMLSALLATAIVGGGTAIIASDGEIIEYAQAMVSEVVCYVVKAEENAVVLYKEGEEEPLMVFAADTSHLPRTDIALLKNGIRLRGMGEVMRLLEDLEIESISME